jgi:hypothetical protein
MHVSPLLCILIRVHLIILNVVNFITCDEVLKLWRFTLSNFLRLAVIFSFFGHNNPLLSNPLYSHSYLTFGKCEIKISFVHFDVPKLNFALLSGRHNTSGINLGWGQLCPINVVTAFLRSCLWRNTASFKPLQSSSWILKVFPCNEVSKPQARDYHKSTLFFLQIDIFPLTPLLVALGLHKVPTNNSCVLIYHKTC